MDILRLVKVLRDMQAQGAAADIAHCRLHGFLHDVSEVSGQVELATALYHIAFHFQRLAADSSPRKSGDKADGIGCRQLIRQDLARAEEGIQRRAGDTDTPALRVGDDLHGAFSAERPDFALQIAHAGLSGIAGDHLADCIVRHAHL